jgi:putative SOS response-associated peptidase YedK
VDSFEVDPPDFAYPPRFNIAPTQDAPIIAQVQERRRMGLLRWGLVPFWAKELAIGNRMINARAETIAGKPAFRTAFKRRRCLVPADGFFEWKKEPGGEDGGKQRKVPHWIHRVDRGPFVMAGLWEKWSPDQGPPVHTFTIITTQAAPAIREIHPRMPVILQDTAIDEWLDLESSPERLLDLLGPLEEGITAYPVSTLVNSPGNDLPECIEAV